MMSSWSPTSSTRPRPTMSSDFRAKARGNCGSTATGGATVSGSKDIKPVMSLVEPGEYDGLPFHGRISVAPYSVLIFSQDAK